MRAQQPTCQLGHVIGVQAQSTRLHAGNRTGPTNPPLAISTIRAYARTATCVPARPRHWRSSTIHALARTATAPVPPIRRLSSAQSASMRAQQPTCQLGHIIGIHAQSTRLHARQPHRSRQSAACHQHNPRVCAHSSAGSSSIVPAVMRYGPHTCTHDNSQRCFLSSSRDTPPMAHDTAAPPPQHVSCMKMRYASWLDWRNVFSLGAGDKHGRDLQAD